MLALLCHIEVSLETEISKGIASLLEVVESVEK